MSLINDLKITEMRFRSERFVVIIIYFENIAFFHAELGFVSYSPLQSVLLSWKSEFCLIFMLCYLSDTLGSGGAVEEAARARVRCA